MLTVNLAQEKEVISLFNRYVKTVDSRNVESWPDFFADEASYMVISREHIERNLPLAFVHDHTKDRILDRVTSITKVWSGHYNDYQPRHLCSNIDLQWINDKEVTLTANFSVYVTEPNVPASRLLVVGEYIDHIVFENDRPKFKSKKVILDTTVIPRYFVYPL